jgi:hypothetical protein
MALRWFCTYDSAWTTPLCMYSSELTKRESNALVLTTATSTTRSPSNQNLMQMQHNPVHETVVIVPYLLEVFSGLPTMLEDRSHFNNR